MDARSSGALGASPAARPALALDAGWQVTLPASGEAAERTQPFPTPGQWHTHGLLGHEGQALHGLDFEAPTRSGWPFLCFDGVDYLADVVLNDRPVGSHEGYFQPFALDVSEALRPGPNALRVTVSSPREEAGPVWPYRKQLIKGIFNHHDCRPGAWHPDAGQTGNTGGIWGDVRLEWRADPHLVSVRATTHLVAGRATVVVALTARRRAPGQATPLSVVLRDAAGAVVGATHGELAVGQGRATLAFHVEAPELWWSWDFGDQPLYTLEVRLGDDHLAQPLGFRTIAEEGGIWRLNGQRVFLRGTNIIPAQWLSTYTTAQIAEDVRLMVAAGINIVRVHAHVTRPEFYAACDRAGLMVWQDFALQWSYSESAAFAANASQQIGEMVRQLRAHPAIVAWCCHNEPVGQEATLDPLLVAAVQAEDGSRVLRSHSDFREHPYPGWYYGDRASFEALPGAPLVTEFGAQALPSEETLATFLAPEALWPPDWERWAYHDFQYEQTVWIAGIAPHDGTGGAALGTLADFVARSQAYQAAMLEDAIDHYRRARYQPIGGVFQFMFVDGWPAITWSVVDHLRRPKAGYAALKRAFAPVWLSLRMPTRVHRAGLPLTPDVRVVNDRKHGLEGLTIAFALAGPAGEPLGSWTHGPFDLAADTLYDPSPALKDALATDAAWRGACVLTAELSQAGKVFSEAARPIVLDALPPGLAAYKAVDML